MTTFGFPRFLAGAATAVAFSLVSGSAFAHGAGMGGGHIVNGLGHITSTNLTVNGTDKLIRLGDHDGRRFRFSRYNYFYPATLCVHRWTEFGRVRICPDYDN
jgi:hypothetical protein